MPGITRTVREMKKVSDGLVSGLDTAEGRISGPQDSSTRSSKTEKQGEKKTGKTHKRTPKS